MLPDDFLSTAREMGLIIPISGWVMKEACRQAKEWQERYPSETPLSVGVNLSAGQVQNLRTSPGGEICASGTSGKRT